MLSVVVPIRSEVINRKFTFEGVTEGVIVNPEIKGKLPITNSFCL